MGRKQSVTDRLERLNQGRCPVHGLPMSQIDQWFYPKRARPYTIVGCGRRECKIQVKAYSIDGPWELLPQFARVLEERAIVAELIAARPRKVVRLMRAKKADIWARTGGRCYWCGAMLEFTRFGIDHVSPQKAGGGYHLENVVPCCTNCNSAKGTKSVVDFRFYRAMQRFEKQHGVTFTRIQLDYLKSIGAELEIPEHAFWFEKELDHCEAVRLTPRSTADAPEISVPLNANVMATDRDNPRGKDPRCA